VALELADLLRARGDDPVALSADAFQVYEGLDVLTAKPDAEQLERLEHRLVSFVPVEEQFSVAQFAELAHGEIDALAARGRTPIVVGGTGLYLRAALTELDLKPHAQPELRAEIERDLEDLGAEVMHARLPAEVAGAVHPRDCKRIVRALELERMGESVHERSNQLWSSELRQPTALFGLVMERDVLDQRIEARVERMLDEGAIDEVERALERGASRTARKAIGFAEITALLEGDASREAVAERIARRHRQYGKRQLTWMRKLSGIEIVDRTELSERETAALLVERLDSLPGR
jgi:tRNA dimethylallyltransferase